MNDVCMHQENEKSNTGYKMPTTLRSITIIIFTNSRCFYISICSMEFNDYFN